MGADWGRKKAARVGEKTWGRRMWKRSEQEQHK